ncbi:MAG: Mannose-1-phosphate guanylyltransferase 1 [candidate division WS2 bacterium ADurb.Bin280]|uniref:Mannose-1-phosphate guanylyltransferase 1 n=1 Tax=candidate division WS2 bacterium ADurb.Bin280 TaxID=1852829 RepID=A0A1V5SEF5_9BACT|nr:MAG: Mannose-1-phosphate guanylyltransferase 1 [candidate division WS2 bacterium ADurb.Bin280]
MNYAVIMAGGTGTRLWPMSRTGKPKQFHKLVSDKTLIQETYDRVKKAIPEKNIFISTNVKYEEEIKAQLPEVPAENFIIEPAKRNTAPALAFLAAQIYRKDKDAIIATLASDHVVSNVDVFANSMKTAFKTVEKYPDHLVLVGINPTRPDTGLGYIKMGSVRSEIDKERVFEVDKFLEKPDLKMAEKYLQSWEYLWNAAYYFFTAKQAMNWFKEYVPKTHKIMMEIDALQAKGGNGTTATKIKELFQKSVDEQFEFAVIEKLNPKKVLVIPADLGWSDIGNWGTLHDVLSENYSSTMISKGYHLDVNSEGCLVYGGDKMIATIGLKDIVIVDTPDAIMIANKNKAQDVKKLLDKFKEEGKHLYL